MTMKSTATNRAGRCGRASAWLAAAGLAFLQTGHASDAIYVGKNLTKDGGVMLAGFGDEPSKATGCRLSSAASIRPGPPYPWAERPRRICPES